MRSVPWSLRAAASLLLALGLAIAVCAEGQRAGPAAGLVAPRTEDGPNSAQAQMRHYVVLVSLDGFRWDYARRDGAEHLLALAKQGAWAPEGMLSSFPALGLPNQYSIVTGLYPGHHGLVTESFYDPERKASFSATDEKDAADGSWYGGLPLWSLAESQGMRAAAIFWPGDEAKIGGFRPSYSLRPGSKADGAECVEQILKWLRLPAAERPHFVAANLAEPGHEARAYGPDAAETKAAVLKMDALVGKLKAGLDATGLPVDLVVVSDGGVAKTEGGWITLDQFTNLSTFKTYGPLLYGETEPERTRVYNQLKHVSSLFVVYRLKNVPAELHANLNARVGDPVVIATGPYAIRAHGPEAGKPDKPPPAGVGGLDPYDQQQMKGIFFAAGPDVLPGKTVAPFENVNLYPWMAHMLGLKTPKCDGNPNILSGTLRDDGAEPGGNASK
jgi:Type I phosphodiesterase / nucleotide pyrophosphatase